MEQKIEAVANSSIHFSTRSLLLFSFVVISKALNLVGWEKRQQSWLMKGSFTALFLEEKLADFCAPSPETCASYTKPGLQFMLWIPVPELIRCITSYLTCPMLAASFSPLLIDLRLMLMNCSEYQILIESDVPLSPTPLFSTHFTENVLHSQKQLKWTIHMCHLILF